MLTSTYFPTYPTHIQRRIAAALSRASVREHNAQFVGRNPRTGALVFYVKSSSKLGTGYTQYTYRTSSEGGYVYLDATRPPVWASCNCAAGTQGYPCDHAARAAKAAVRRLNK